MSFPKLTVEHIEFASNAQLAKLLNVHPSTTSHWLSNNFRLGNLKIWYECIELETLAAGFVRRKNKAQKSKKIQKEFDEIIANSKKFEEHMSA